MAPLELELVIVRIRNYGRTYWLVADELLTRAYPPHVSERVAIANFAAESGRVYAHVETYREHHTPAEAAKRIREHFT